MNDFEKAKKLLGYEPTNSDEPFDSLRGWKDTEKVVKKKK